MRTLLLGGTTEASHMARALAEAKVPAVFSYAGRTDSPVPQPLPMRIGGFGGVEGLVQYLRREAITHVIDATHPFAAQMSRNADAACAATGVPLIGLGRPPWTPEPGDRWSRHPDIEAVVAALPDTGRIFLAIGKKAIGAFAARPDLHYLLRLVDAPDAPLPLPDHRVIIARGPFDADQDEALMRAGRITHVVAKNAGGRGAEAKLIAARRLGLPVMMIDRPALPGRHGVATVGAVLDWLRAGEGRHPCHAGSAGTARGV